MHCVFRPLICSSLALTLAVTGHRALFAQEHVAVRALPAVDFPPEEAPKKDLKAGYKTEKEARTFTLSIPGPRGQIVDRNGVALAQNRVVQYLALNFPFLGANATDAQIIAYARDGIKKANSALRKTWSMTDERLISHYKNRRWLPLVFSITDGLNEELSDTQISQL